MDLEAKKAVVRRIRNNLQVTEVFCTRIVKGRNGSVLVGLTATLDEATSLEEGDIATLVLGERADQLAYDRALAGSVITSREHTDAMTFTKNNYNLLLDEKLKVLGLRKPKPVLAEEMMEH